MAQTDTARLLTPLGFLGALAVAAGVWFLPLPGPEEPREVVRVGPGPNGSDTSRTQAVGQTPDHDWLALAEPLSKLRDPVEEPTDGGGPPPPPPPPAVTVRYLGFVGAGDDRSAALVEIDGTQRFVSVGDVVMFDDRDDLVIEEITPEKVIYSMGNVESTATRSTSSGDNTPNARPRPATPTIPPDEDRLRGRVSLR